jgi:hypothetical protein
LAGSKALAAYWAPKLKNKLGSAFTLDELAVIGDRSITKATTANHSEFTFTSIRRAGSASCRPKDWWEV